MGILYKLLHNYCLMAAVFSWMCAQVCKTLITLITTHRFDSERLFGAGGMPSAHSAMVSAISVSIGRRCGLESPEFALAIAFMAVVMYDAMGVRRAAGEQARILNRMVGMWEENGAVVTRKELKEHLGHTPMEVLGGAMLGILVAIALI